MEQLNLPFRLGMDYEELEFDLEIISDRLIGYDSYIYISNRVSRFLNYDIDRTELIFRSDVLEAVIISFNYMSYRAYKDVAAQLENLFGSSQIVIEHSYSVYKYKLHHKITWIVYTSDTTYIIVVKDNIIHNLLYSLLW